MNKQHLGYGGTPFDSLAEAKASFRFAELSCFHAKSKFSQTFKDMEGTEFRACPDFYHARYGLYLEFKTATLNGVKTKASADKQLNEKEAFKGSLSLYDRLKLQWNHARRKHAIVQKALTPQNYVVVFESAVPIAAAVDYINAGIVFCTLASLPSYLAKVRLAQLGLHVAFTMPYIGSEVEGLSLTLGGNGSFG